MVFFFFKRRNSDFDFEFLFFLKVSSFNLVVHCMLCMGY